MQAVSIRPKSFGGFGSYVNRGENRFDKVCITKVTYVFARNLEKNVTNFSKAFLRRSAARSYPAYFQTLTRGLAWPLRIFFFQSTENNSTAPSSAKKLRTLPANYIYVLPAVFDSPRFSSRVGVKLQRVIYG